MRNLLSESKILFNEAFNEEQQKVVGKLILEAEEGEKDIFLKSIWEYDQYIGGIGGYSMPPNPIYNPYPGGEYRELFRPLQYARSDMHHDLQYYSHHRNIVMMSGMHLEGVLRAVLKKTKTFGSLRYATITLGKATNEIKKMNIQPPAVINSLYAFVKLYNKSKHEVNHDEERERLFDLSDAIVCYLAARVIRVKLLVSIEHDSVFYEYKINDATFR